MDKRAKLLEQIRNNSKNVDYNDLIKLLVLYGLCV